MQIEQTSVPRLIAVCGKGRLAATALGYLHHALAAWGLDATLVACPVATDTGEDDWQPSLAARARRLDVRVARIGELEQEPDMLLLSLQYDRIIRVSRFASQRMFNLHFSRLPDYRGVYTAVWPILDAAPRVGVTLHVLEAGIDTGAIVAQRAFDLPPRATAWSLYERYIDEGLEILREWAPRLLRGPVQPLNQPGGVGSYYGRKSLDFAAVQVDPTWEAERIDRFVRAFHFPAYQLPTWGGRPVWSCATIEGRRDEPAGTCVLDTGESATFVVGGGELVHVLWAPPRADEA